MKKFLLVVFLLLCSCNHNQQRSLQATYDNVYWYINYDNGGLNVELYEIVDHDIGKYELTKSWEIEYDRYKIVYSYRTYELQEQHIQNRFYDYGTYYLIENYWL